MRQFVPVLSSSHRLGAAVLKPPPLRYRVSALAASASLGEGVFSALAVQTTCLPWVPVFVEHVVFVLFHSLCCSMPPERTAAVKPVSWRPRFLKVLGGATHQESRSERRHQRVWTAPRSGITFFQSFVTPGLAVRSIFKPVSPLIRHERRRIS